MNKSLTNEMNKCWQLFSDYQAWKLQFVFQVKNWQISRQVQSFVRVKSKGSTHTHTHTHTQTNIHTHKHAQTTYTHKKVWSLICSFDDFLLTTLLLTVPLLARAKCEALHVAYLIDWLTTDLHTEWLLMQKFAKIL